jgi:muramoyltetrapeptide carboxypeptidase
MDRKQFIGQGAALTAGWLGASSLTVPQQVLAQGPDYFHTPPHLKKGDLIGITSPAGYMTEKELAPALAAFAEWGFQVRIGRSIGKRDCTFGGTDEERTADLQEMLDDPMVRCIFCARGGYGMVRIIDRLNFEAFRNEPKWVVGFSDITVIHAHLHQLTGVSSLHAKMCNSFPDDWSKAEPAQVDSILSIRDALIGKKARYVLPGNLQNRLGYAEGILIGGNLKTLESLSGSRSDFRTAGKLLFVEDTGEYLYSIDRMFWNLQRTGKLQELAGLIVGGFKIKPDDPGEEFGRTLYEIVMEKVAPYPYPVCFDFPVGHQKFNVALKCGVRHRLKVEDQEVLLEEHKEG